MGRIWPKLGPAHLSAGIVLLLALPSCRQADRPSPLPPDVAPKPQRPNIILLTVDTLRADHMALYGYERDTMPAVEAFAKTAVVFDNAVVPRSLTRPSYASMLTGLYPFHHGVRSNAAVLHEDLTTLPEVLKSAGYHTAGFVSNFILVGELSGFDRDFDVYDDRVEETTFKRFHYERTAGNTVKAILEWLDSKPSQPFFLFVNLMDPHGPYTPPERLGRLYHSGKSRILNRYQIPTYQFIEGQLNYFDYVDRYDGEICFADEAMGTLIEELKRRDLWDTSLVVFTADHGELLGEHNNIFFEHYFHVWEETMHVPLVIRLSRSSQRQTGSPHRPAVAGPKRIRSLCSPMDLMPTILAHLNLSCDLRFDGRNLLPVIGGGEDTDRALLLEFPNMPTPYVALPIPFPDVYAIRTATHKLIRVLNQDKDKSPRQWLFDLVKDPKEQHHIVFDAQDPLHRELGDRLEATLAQVRAYQLPFTLTIYEMPFGERHSFVEQTRRSRKAFVKTLTEEQAQRLRGLGYVQ